MRKNIIIALLIIGVAVSLSVNYAEAISPKLQAFLADLENRIISLEEFSTYQKSSAPLGMAGLNGQVVGSISCNNNDPIINASFDSNAINITFQIWKITDDTLDYHVRNHDINTVTFTIFLTCKG